MSYAFHHGSAIKEKNCGGVDAIYKGIRMKKFWYNEKVYTMRVFNNYNKWDTLYFRTTIHQFRTWRKLVRFLIKADCGFDFKEDGWVLICEIANFQAKKHQLHFRVCYRDLELYLDGKKIASGPVSQVACAFKLIMSEL